jgi:hypothetical protein
MAYNPFMPAAGETASAMRGLALPPRGGMYGMKGPGQGQSRQMEQGFIDSTLRGQNIMPLVPRNPQMSRRRNQPISQQAALANFRASMADAGVIFPGASKPQQIASQMMPPMPAMPAPPQRGAAGRKGMGRGGGQLPMRSMSQNPYV